MLETEKANTLYNLRITDEAYQSIKIYTKNRLGLARFLWLEVRIFCHVHSR